ncbi:MAG: hypothetical protein JSS69_14200 [Acidobacteria bacterium]|nr:hypothetical protein [Acidobacteriota bacterium]MBS1867062.1 hypothetical protein [Acidobacteriota bacterium]
MKKEVLRGLAIVVLVCGFASATPAQTWERIGPEGGNVLSLAVAGDGEVLLGTADGHVFASRDGGETWQLKGRVGSRLDAVVQGLVVDLQGKTRVYAAVWTQDLAAGGGVFRSEDGGRTWAASGLQGEAVRALGQSASQPEVLVAGTRTGVFRSENAGKSWERISPAGDEELKNLDSITIDPRDAHVIYAGTYHLPWKTTDGGKSWKPIAAGMIDDSDVMSVAIDRSEPERIFASACSGIYRSGNGGAQWTKLQGIPYVSRRTQQIVQDPKNAAVWYAGTTEGLWRSKDGGESWERVTGREIVVNAIAFAGKEERLLLGTEEGILSSTDSGKSFSARNSGFTHGVVRAFAARGTDSRRLLIALETDGGGLLESVDGGKHWKAFAAPALAVDALFSVADYWFAALRGGGAAQFDAKTGKWREIRFVMRETVRSKSKSGGAKVTRERVFRPEVSVICALGGRIFAATDKGLWAGGANGGVLLRIAEKQLPEKIVDFTTGTAGEALFVVAQDKLWRSVDGGKSWKMADGPDKAGELLWMRVSGSAQGVVLAGGRNGVFSGVTGPAWGEKREWNLLQAGLPAAASWPGTMNEKFWMVPMRAGGIYVSHDEGKSWERWGEEQAGVVRSAEAIGGEIVWVRTQTDGMYEGKFGE